MADETQIAAPEGTQAPDTQVQDTPAPKAKPAKAAKAVAEDAPAPEPQRQTDPLMAQLVQAQRELESARKELEGHRARAKQYERDQRKASIMSALVDEFPGMARAEIRGAALVAAEDGLVDLYSEDAQSQIDKLKEALRPKSKASKPSTASPAASLGGTPGTAAKPPAPGRKFLI